MTLSLVGLPGSGKSTVGRSLARRLHIPFVDSDHLIEEQLGCSIKDYFAREGEAAFRAMEVRVIGELTSQGEARVISTGGGAVLRMENRDVLWQRTIVIYLSATPEELLRRVRHDGQRPLLQVADPLAKLRELHAQRDPLYREIATLIVETNRHSASSLAGVIARQLDELPSTQ